MYGASAPSGHERQRAAREFRPDRTDSFPARRLRASGSEGMNGEQKARQQTIAGRRRPLQAARDEASEIDRTSQARRSHACWPSWTSRASRPEVVTAGDPDERCARPGTGCLQAAKPPGGCRVTPAFRPSEQAAEGAVVPVRDVDADLLHHPRRRRAPRVAKTRARARQDGTAPFVRQGDGRPRRGQREAPVVLTSPPALAEPPRHSCEPGVGCATAQRVCGSNEDRRCATRRSALGAGSRRRNPAFGGRFGRGAEPPSEFPSWARSPRGSRDPCPARRTPR